ncbi:MAG: EFR1 family ferrodoxin [Ruthenibacterium sp.]
MKINQIYFSPTGSTKKVVQLLAQTWIGDGCDIDCSLPAGAGCDYSVYSFAKDELCIIGVPSFGGRVPAVMLAHLQQMKAAGTPTVLVTTFGNRDYDDTLLELRDTVRQNGFHVIAAIAAVTEHSIMHRFGAGRPNDNDEKQLRDYAKRIQRALESKTVDNLSEAAVSGSSPYKAFGSLPLKPAASNACTLCGTCAALCPVEAIPADNPRKTDKERCITCMRCVSICPQHARKLNPVVLFAAEHKMKKSCSTPKENSFFLGSAL